LKPEEIEQSDVKTLLDLKVSRLQTEQKELSERLKSAGKRIDHTERAYRKEEIPLLEKDYENQQKTDKAFHEASRKANLVNAKQQFDEDMKMKQRLTRIMGDFTTYKNKLEEKRKQILDAKHREAEEAIEKEKQERIALWREKRDEIIRQREAERAEQARREQEEREIAEREEMERAEKEARLAKERAETAEKQK
jgi:translation initiation factor 3 subunit A